MENVAGNYYDKYNSKNPIARALMAGFLSSFDALVEKSGASSALEVGCGEGHLSIRLANAGLSLRAIDLEPDAIEQAKSLHPGIHFEAQDLYDLDPIARSELVVCCEVLEHVPDPEKALNLLSSVADPWLLLSVPREPLWRVLNTARGKYLGDLGNTPGHVQHWSTQGFLKMIANHAKIIEVRKPLPWTMVLCKTS